MKESNYYDKIFYLNHYNEPYQSALEFIPIIYDTLKPTSVVDFGCGIGNWIKVWLEETPVKDILGIEGPYISKDLYKVDEKYILLKDLKEPIDLGRKFDVAISLEVGEHLPDEFADVFVSNIVKVSDIVIFSAAIKGQLGTYHINEQYPEYWANKFAKHHYVAVDYFRSKIWTNSKIKYWYRQNVLIYIKKEALTNHPFLEPYYTTTNPECLLRIHPDQFELKLQQIERTSTILGFIHWRLYLLKLSVKKTLKIK